MMFRDRAEAGRHLAERLLHLKDADPVVLALPRGGVPIAVPIAEALGAAVDLLLVRKIGAPGHSEYGIGAIVDGHQPQTVLDEEAVRQLGVQQSYIAQESVRQLNEIERRRAQYLHGRQPVGLQGRTVILVDDGIATGVTARAALLGLERSGAARRILAAPVVPPEVAEMLRPLCDEAVFLAEPATFSAVGAFYEDFHQVTDAEVTALLDQAAAWRRQE
ncbi:MAG TPA: phosphoribosyltransferase [Roseomonas sp.]